MRQIRWLSAVICLGAMQVAFANPPLEGDLWRPLGPAPIENFFGGGATGRASAIAVNPFNVDEVWLGTAAGGVWHSQNGGQNWTPLTDFEIALAIGAIAVDDCTTGGCKRIYAGTGENAIRRDTYYGRGLLTFDSTDANPVWEMRTGTPYSFDLGSINDVVLDPTTSGETQRLFITLSSGTTTSASQATVTAPENTQAGGGYGIYRSDDDGATWVKLSVAGANGARPTDLKMNPNNPDELYAGFLSVGAFKSTDGGDSWCPMSQGIAVPAGCNNPIGFNPDVANSFDHIELSLHAANPGVMYASVGHCTGRLFSNCHPSIFKSINGGASWTTQATGTSSPSGGLACPTQYSRYTHALAVHPTVPETVLLGGVKLCRSTNSGATFEASDNNLAAGDSPWGPIIHLDHREIVFHPLDSQRVYSSGDGGFAYSVNGGVDWLPGNDDLQITGLYSLTSSPNTPRLLGGSQDNSGQLYMGFPAWEHVGAGDGAYALIDHEDPLVMYLGANSGALLRSLNGGTVFSTNIKPPGVGGDVAFNAPAVQDRIAPYPLYYGGTQLYRSFDRGSSWDVVSPVLATGFTDEIGPGKNVITAIAAHQSKIYVGYYGGEVFVSKNPCVSEGCWENVGEGLPAAPVTDIVIDPTNTDVAYLAYSGFGSGPRIWKTGNAGENWVAASVGLPADVPANALAIELYNPTRLWAGLDSGSDANRSNVYFSNDAGLSWTPRNAGLPNGPVHDLSIDESRGRIYVGLHGRGAFSYGSPSASAYEGRINGELQDVVVNGTNFPPGESCTLRLLQSTGSQCASGAVDAIGGTIGSDGIGRLVTSKVNEWTDKPVIWGCMDGVCVGDTPIAACTDDDDGDGEADPLASMVVDCAGTVSSIEIQENMEFNNVPGTVFNIGFHRTLSPKNRAPHIALSRRNARAASSAEFELSPVLVSNAGHQEVCRMPVRITEGENSRSVLTGIHQRFERAGHRLSHQDETDTRGAEDECAAGGVTTLLHDPHSEGEDNFRQGPRLLVESTEQRQGELVPAVSMQPGSAAPGTCFSLSGLGNAVHGQMNAVRTTFTTAEHGAQGGYLTYIEGNGLGSCAVTLKTKKGQTAESIAGSIEQLVLSRENQNTKPYCEEAQNARGIRRSKGGLVSRFITRLQVCVEDSGVGIEIGPE